MEAEAEVEAVEAVCCGCGLEHADQCSRLARIPIAGLDRVERVTARVVRKRAVFQHLVLGPLSQRVYLRHHLLFVRSVDRKSVV